MSDPALFQQIVLRLVRALFPKLNASIDPDDDCSLVTPKARIGLTNLRARFDQTNGTESELEALVREHFARLEDFKPEALDELSFEETSDRLLLQIMPANLNSIPGLPILHRPFSTRVNVAVVADFPTSYMYLRMTDVERWEVSADELFDLARDNLRKRSAQLAVNATETGRNALMIVATGDGYDAARILLPELQQVFASRFGETFRVGIPNRDFLICWGLDCDPGLHERVVSQIEKDHAERPYPLSSSVLSHI